MLFMIVFFKGTLLLFFYYNFIYLMGVLHKTAYMKKVKIAYGTQFSPSVL